MKTILRHALFATPLALALAGCGGGGGGGSGPAPGPVAGGSDIPASALQDVQGLVAWANDIIANRTSSTAEPLAVGDVKLPTSDTAEPI